MKIIENHRKLLNEYQRKSMKITENHWKSLKTVGPTTTVPDAVPAAGHFRSAVFLWNPMVPRISCPGKFFITKNHPDGPPPKIHQKSNFGKEIY